MPINDKPAQRLRAMTRSRHCEERSDAAVHAVMDCRAPLAMTRQGAAGMFVRDREAKGRSNPCLRTTTRRRLAQAPGLNSQCWHDAHLPTQFFMNPNSTRSF